MVTGAAVWPGVHISDNWEEIVEEICRSNIIQRDNIKFARKLSKDLVPIAKEKNKTVSMDKGLIKF